MDATPERLPPLFYTAIEQELAAQPEGIAEYALIQTLKGRGFFDFLPPAPAPPYALFRAHFLLFHALYRLRDRLAGAGEALLEIAPLCIRLMPWSASEAALESADPLRDYYLDWRHLEETGETEVADLIAGFWQRLAKFEHRDCALAELGLTDPVDDDIIKSAWRRLAMEHHPDRGGDTARLQAINAAVDCLLK